MFIVLWLCYACLQFVVFFLLAVVGAWDLHRDLRIYRCSLQTSKCKFVDSLHSKHQYAKINSSNQMTTMIVHLKSSNGMMIPKGHLGWELFFELSKLKDNELANNVRSWDKCCRLNYKKKKSKLWKTFWSKLKKWNTLRVLMNLIMMTVWFVWSRSKKVRRSNVFQIAVTFSILSA